MIHLAKYLKTYNTKDAFQEWSLVSRLADVEFTEVIFYGSFYEAQVRALSLEIRPHTQ